MPAVIIFGVIFGSMILCCVVYNLCLKNVVSDKDPFEAMKNFGGSCESSIDVN